MKGRGFIILLAVFAALVVITLLQSQPAAAPTPSATEVFPFLRVYPDIGVDNIQAIRLREPESERTFTISRGADGAWMAADRQGQLDPDAATIIARTIVLLPYQRTLPLTDTTDLTEFGFRPNGQLSIEVLLENNIGRVVAVGSLAPTQLTYYALVDDRPEIYLLERAAIDYLITQLQSPPVS